MASKNLRHPHHLTALLRRGGRQLLTLAIAALWALSSEWDWAEVSPECQTGQPYSSITLPSAFQYSTKVFSGTPKALILRKAQVVLVALLITMYMYFQKR